MPEQFDPTSIKPIRWGTLTQLANGHWLMSWEIELESLDATQLEDVATAAADAEAGFKPNFTSDGKTGLAVTVETTRWGMEDDYYGLTWRLFRLIDSRLGRIRLIQGTPREWRYPFTSE